MYKLIRIGMGMLLAVLFSTATLAKSIVGAAGSQIVVHKYIGKHNLHLELQLPVIKQLGAVKVSPSKLNQLNQRIRNEFIKYDTQDIDIYLDTSGIKILFDSQDYLSFTLHIETSDMTSRYFDKYYVIDKRSVQILSPRAVRRRFGFSLAHINSQIKHYIDGIQIPTNEMDVVLEQFIGWYKEDEQFYQTLEPTGVYLKPNVLGISYDSNKFTQTIEFSLKTKNLLQH